MRMIHPHYQGECFRLNQVVAKFFFKILNHDN